MTQILAPWAQAVNDFIYRRVNPTYGTTTGAANTYTLTLPTGSLAGGLVVGMQFVWRAHQTNTTTATFTVQGAGVLGPNVININGAALTGGEIQSGDIVTATWDGAVWQMARQQSITRAEWCGTAGGSANAITLTPTPAISIYLAGQRFAFLIASANTAAVTVAVSGLSTPQALTKFGTIALVANDLPAGSVAEIEYDGTRFQLLNVRPYAQGADVASAATINLDTTTGDYVHITGTVTCTAITLAQGQQRTTVTDGAMLFTNGASLILPSGADITSAAGDTQVWRGEASGVVRCIAYVRIGQSFGVPTGTIAAYAGTTAPIGWAMCDASSQLRTGIWAPLFAVIGTTYGSADGTHYTLPDIRGRVIAGVDNMGGSTASRITNAVAGIVGTTLGATGGDQAMQAHTHTGGATTPGASATGANGAIAVTTTGSTGAGGSQNVQPTIMLNYIIKL